MPNEAIPNADLRAQRDTLWRLLAELMDVTSNNLTAIGSGVREIRESSEAGPDIRAMAAAVLESSDEIATKVRAIRAEEIFFKGPPGLRTDAGGAGS